MGGDNKAEVNQQALICGLTSMLITASEKYSDNKSREKGSTHFGNMIKTNSTKKRNDI